MSEPALTIWLLAIPVVVAVVDLVRTVSALKKMPRGAPGGGAWSRALHLRF